MNILIKLFSCFSGERIDATFASAIQAELDAGISLLRTLEQECISVDAQIKELSLELSSILSDPVAGDLAYLTIDDINNIVKSESPGQVLLVQAPADTEVELTGTMPFLSPSGLYFLHFYLILIVAPFGKLRKLEDEPVESAPDPEGIPLLDSELDELPHELYFRSPSSRMRFFSFEYGPARDPSSRGKMIVTPNRHVGTSKSHMLTTPSPPQPRQPTSYDGKQEHEDSTSSSRADATQSRGLELLTVSELQFSSTGDGECSVHEGE